MFLFLPHTLFDRFIMQRKHIALATLAMIAATQSFAVTNVSGASASAIGYVEALSAACGTGANAGNVSVFVRGASTNALGNNFTVLCNSGNFAGTTENEVRFDVSGGSLNAIMFSNSVATADASSPLVGSGAFLASAATTACPAAVATAPLSNFLGTTVARIRNCASNATLTSGKSVGGFLDLEPAIFKGQGVIAGNYTVKTAKFSQAFAVGVSQALYEALQAAQTLTVGATDPANQPSLSRAQLAALINSNDNGAAKNNGPKFLLPATAETNITYCRRPATSGTQMGAEVYFLQAQQKGFLAIHEPSYLTGTAPAGFDPVANGGTVVVDNATGNTLTVQLNSGTGDLVKCLNRTAVGTQAAATPGAFAFGFLSAENNPVGSTNSYRLVKLNGSSTTEGVSGDSQTKNALTGNYDYVFESALFNPTNNAVLNAINNNVKTGAGTPGVFLNVNAGTAAESKITRNNSSLKPLTFN
jgi:hypothetical protein